MKKIVIIPLIILLHLFIFWDATVQYYLDLKDKLKKKSRCKKMPIVQVLLRILVMALLMAPDGFKDYF